MGHHTWPYVTSLHFFQTEEPEATLFCLSLSARGFYLYILFILLETSLDNILSLSNGLSPVTSLILGIEQLLRERFCVLCLNNAIGGLLGFRSFKPDFIFF